MRDYALYVEDILDSVLKIKRYVKGKNFEKFSRDEKTIDAVIRNFEIMGEAVRQLPKRIRDKYPDIEWKAIIDFRNVIIHEYFGIDLEIIWDIIETKLFPLEQKLEKIEKGLED
ncbi:MAG: DUF86 domain-containing protein [Candidatus Omnitrophota bacterium]